MVTYQQQLNHKIEYLRDLFQDLDIPAIQVFESPEKHYRMRAEFRVWHEGDEIFYAMFERGQKASGASLVRCDQFEAADKAINALMPRLIDAVNSDERLKTRWYAVEFLSTLSGEMLVTMIYHKKLDDEWVEAARALQDKLGIFIIGRSRGQKVVLAQDFVTETLNVGGRDFKYRQIEGGFTQPNAKVCEKMLAWACGAADGLGGDMLELYCGNGNFTLPLAQKFDKVLATEVSKTSVNAALWNIEANGNRNIKIARLSAEEFTEAYTQQRAFRRLQEQGIGLEDYRFSTIFVDPPRAGVDVETLKLVAGFDNVIYVSCNPETLKENLAVLSQTHRIERMALFDQFPFTHHIESGVLLKRKG
ncbi:tRNA (uridine(54)-C5)-methyltransferase TrmA [Neisseria animalis]|uniref:tRNA/tmRNA (uracil-C(5))-methyltransferase n=1 Tax=Neisseria animalis TaxID=492 RepID=A0A5P3MWB2_NEIAN|nr:tRNA (uridine(54)-C5)-methyltransferase TrmA [Neisseria animalis]QEY25051.1 tRNA (uridine(54)-C5)-methyltransferase TrmA [Neisseria animalis]ROW33090.1 tRNA (uridine(54)-C5)-methyltransferase TrmA [Neisseria animalis]VEE07182.1 tRNA (uracil-5-)-methyltransferase [Neisseria animalis]